ncbi:serine protease [Chamaesiphon sp. VAR_48_metabat_135_sub]|uniref:S1 family peptidase n=1 Tax=Chamaesiphon sp. VAR_48_metabat_135_sub TaxID=2964699 RepID=UPI00286A7DB3|nr:serine protease [Chamaesiphon sp. VAR_48_metabat_135_sub]
MFYRYLVPIFLIATSVIVSPPQVDAIREARAILPRDVGAIGKKTVVRIEAPNGSFGSGVIIGRVERGNRNIYMVLTAAHVVASPRLSYQLVAPRPLNSSPQRPKPRFEISARNIQILPRVDLALVSFESNLTFAIGTIGNSAYVDEGSPVYVAGFPQPGRAIPTVTYQFTGGMVSSRLDGDEDNSRASNNGYDIAYTSVTRAGMSGGPVFDAAARIVAIHGRGDRNIQTTVDTSSEFGGSVKTGINLGIPIQAFLKLYPSARTTIGVRLDLSPVNYLITDNSGTIGTSNKRFAKKLRTRNPDVPIVDVTKVDEATEE